MTGRDAAPDWPSRARALTDELDALGALRSEWRATFEQTPRHVFVPTYYREDGTLLDSGDPGQRGQWLAGVYRDEPLMTQRLPVPGADSLLWASSSSSGPSLMARMLGLLDVRHDDRVLEIGTGTGYNAALLCHRLGDANVTSVDIDPALVQAAGERLATRGYRPHLRVGHGAAGVPERAPFDRIIATAAVPAVPLAWIQQLAADGIIVADIRGELVSTLVVLHKATDGGVSGRFLPVPGHFMWLRATAANPLRDGGSYLTEINVDNPRTTSTTVDPAVFDDIDLRFLIQHMVPEIERIGSADQHGRPVAEIAAGASRTHVDLTCHDDTRMVTETGPTALWRQVASVLELWCALDRPARDRFGLTVTSDGHQRLWLDDPVAGHEWALPAG